MASRRDLLRAGLTLGGIAAAGHAARLFERLAAQSICPSAGPLGELLAHVPFVGTGGPEPRYGELVGGPGLDARLFTDLSGLAPDRLITPSDRVFVRTTAPQGPGVSAIDVDGLLDRRVTIPVAELGRLARPMGQHLIECAGNTDPRNYGLMSVAEWDGVPLADVLSRVRPAPKATAVRVSGLDPDTPSSRRSLPGASWVFPLETLERLGAFLAVRMNGAPLPPDHGAPIRLVVPGWYGCAWIKWVNEIGLVGADEPATTQMKEFAGRTHQDGVPLLARDFAPPEIDLAATPVRVEKRRVDGRIEYRIVGIVWGGDRPIDRLKIRFSSRGAFVPLELCPPPRTHRTWSLWEHRWRPEGPGVYDIVLKALDPGIRTRRLDVYFYVRRVIIHEV
jgi:DMSO/TMAO reductase YedYZ molybdopterin-dependent catalytic subunit